MTDPSSPASEPEWPILPAGLELARTTPQFDQESVPKALLAAHKTAAGVWGNVVVAEGSIDFEFEDDEGLSRSIKSGETQAIPPERAHRLTVTGKVDFAVEFHRPPTA